MCSSYWGSCVQKFRNNSHVFVSLFPVRHVRRPEKLYPPHILYARLKYLHGFIICTLVDAVDKQSWNLDLV